jgi:hypothetical protein
MTGDDPASTLKSACGGAVSALNAAFRQGGKTRRRVFSLVGAFKRRCDPAG